MSDYSSVQGLLHRQAIEELFDDYAETFEDHLVDKLGYRGPEVIEGLIQSFAAEDEKTPQGAPWFENVVDVGCGTGLCAVKLRPFSGRLTGIDVSQGMLDVAARKGHDGIEGSVGQLYEELVAADAAVGLKKLPAGSIDLVVAGDMFIYVWSVEAVLKACAHCLRPGGMMIFTAETLEEGSSEEGWIERESERFAHCRSYLVRHCEAQGLRVEHVETVSLRREKGYAGPQAGDIDEEGAGADSEVKKPKYLPAEALVVRKIG
eukprot:TRINITY_DN6572_c1_g2_i1.p1 TRINITY_DN6572_c1_g2~~TRINITY_DN6572_c1_g2_i1.p1  ORF type:complete len:262 (-),score=58.61 TRINITY_DN6572_c1_g2_i1:90-875(-)